MRIRFRLSPSPWFVGLGAVLAMVVVDAGAVRIGGEGRAVAQTGVTATRQCSALTSFSGRRGDLPNPTTTITSATLMPAAAAPTVNAPGGTASALPEHCEVVGQIDDRVGANAQRFAINFRLRLPVPWNGRFFFQGGGGTNGTLGNALGALQGQQTTVALALGYAVVSQDSGHDNATNDDPQSGGTQTFGFDPKARIDFGYRSYDEVTRVAKALIQRYYLRGPEKSYYVGCSEGGREGMMLSQRFAAHFDGILACAPGFHLPQAAVAGIADSQAFAAVAREAGVKDPNGLPLLNKTFTDEDLAVASRAVLAACDRLDDLEDGLVENFPACTDIAVQPRLTAITCAGAKTPGCLSAAQVKALEKAFAATKTADGTTIYPPRAWDAGIGGKVGDTHNQGWRIWKIGAYASPTNNALNATLSSTALASIFITPPTAVATTDGDQVAFGLSLDLTQTARVLGSTAGNYRESALDFMKADSTDLSAFRARGGRLIIVHGVSDPVFSIVDTVNWWNALNARTRGTAAAFARLFAVPGMNHCSGGPATDRFDAFGALVDWVERGTAPERIVATARAATPWPGRTRPLCAYPKQARYTGTGSIEDATNFVCR